MENREQPEDSEKEQADVHSESPDNLDVADVVSLESVVNVLIRKGVCTAEELFEEEQSRRLYLDKAKNISLVRTDRKGRSSRRHKQSWLKRKMSRRKWTRRLGTALFGWEWKKVKNNRRVMHRENLKK